MHPYVHTFFTTHSSLISLTSPIGGGERAEPSDVAASWQRPASGHEAAGMVIQSTRAPRRCGSKTLVRQPRDTDRCSADRYSATTTDRYRRVRQLFAPPSLDVAPPPAPPPSPRARGWTNGEASAILWQVATQARKGLAVQPNQSQVNGWAYP